jgi:hypothetical protein
LIVTVARAPSGPEFAEALPGFILMGVVLTDSKQGMAPQSRGMNSIGLQKRRVRGTRERS